MVAAIVASSLESGPIAFKRAAAALGASGVRVTDGGCSLYASAGASARPTSAGSDAATNQVIHAPGMKTPSSAASFMQSRFWAAAVRNSAEEFTEPWNWAWTRKEPSFLAEGVPWGGFF